MLIRVYESARAADSALADWPVGTSGLSLLDGGTWFAFGPGGALQPIAGLNGMTQEVTTTKPPAPVLTQLESDQNACVRLITGAVADWASDRQRFASEIGDFENLYPGITNMLKQQISEDERPALATFQTDEVQFEVVLAALEPSLKPFCVDPPSR
ncbi:hypothetical protein BH09ACT6_BH09ACT6_15680 [soil metagenome]